MPRWRDGSLCLVVALLGPAAALDRDGPAPGAPVVPGVPAPEPAVRSEPPQPRANVLANGSFRIEYDASGIRSLRRTNDVHDTDYVAAGGALGPIVVRYRTAPHGDWRELRELLLRPDPVRGRSMEYVLATYVPTLAARSSPSAERGVGGLRGLNDGLVPAALGTPGAANVPIGAPAGPVPLFTWTTEANEPGTGGPGAPGRTRWVQYTFPADEEVARIQVFWVEPPERWRLLYQADRQWKEVVPRGPYGTAAGIFTTVEFEPVRTIALRIEVTMPPGRRVSLAEWRVGPDPPLAPPGDVLVTGRFTLEGDALDWTITLANPGPRPVEVGDLGIPLDFAERVQPPADIYTRKLIRHAFVAGHGSWVYWQRSNGEGPFLLMLPSGDTKLEYVDSSGVLGGYRPGVFTAFVHARAASASAVGAGGHWRLPVSGLRLPAGSSKSYTFRFRWIDAAAGARDALVAAGKLDVAVVPGMVVPTDLPALIALRTTQAIRAVEAEHPGQTTVTRLGQQEGGAAVYEVRFARLGENVLTVRYGDDRWLTLEFFVTEPLETLVRKRAAFLVSHHQHTDPSTWYVGVYGDWDQRNEVRRGPEDRDGLSTWLTDANDDAGNARPAFVASKNVFFPERREIESLELYIRKYLWGGMQMTSEEAYPYAIYGVPNWWANRASADPGRAGRAHVWRIYDYPHIILLYYRMYQIAKFYPDQVAHLDAPRYLERAYRTAVAYWTVPLAVEGWSADAVGTMNEAIVPELIEALEREGRRDWADTLRGYWEGKVERFVNRTPHLYASEFAFDSTGFESTGAIARYAMTREEPRFRARVSREAAERFLELQLRLNVTDRGWLETTYYQLGSDYRGNPTYLLSYMSQMGGWSILDHALHFAADPAEYLRLGYASTLSSWALVNSGPAESGHGYWFPSPNNDGAAGGGFMPEPMGRAWIGKTVRRGAWPYSAEQDVGYCGALRAHATIVAHDPVFGEIAYGGVLTRAGDAVSVIPRDGLRVRFHVVRGAERLHLVLDRDGYAKERPVVVRDGFSRIAFTLENRAGSAHRTALSVAGLPPGIYVVSVDGAAVATVRGGSRAQIVELPVGAAAASEVTIVRQERRARTAPRRE